MASSGLHIDCISIHHDTSFWFRLSTICGENSFKVFLRTFVLLRFDQLFRTFVLIDELAFAPSFHVYCQFFAQGTLKYAISLDSQVASKCLLTAILD
jgi:tellurite resistance protein TehA-like permease